jgi:hypothetical protein
VFLGVWFQKSTFWAFSSLIILHIWVWRWR